MVLLIVRIVGIVGQVGIVALESPVSLVVMTGVVGSDLGRGYEARDRGERERERERALSGTISIMGWSRARPADGGKGKSRPNWTIADQYTFARG